MTTQSEAYAVPLQEQLSSVPDKARLVIDDPDGMGIRFIPVGRMCNEAAAELRRLDEIASLTETMGKVNRSLMAEADRLEAVNKQLLKALRNLLDSHAVPSSICKERPAYEAARAAIAAAKEQA